MNIYETVLDKIYQFYNFKKINKIKQNYKLENLQFIPIQSDLFVDNYFENLYYSYRVKIKPVDFTLFQVMKFETEEEQNEVKLITVGENLNHFDLIYSFSDKRFIILRNGLKKVFETPEYIYDNGESLVIALKVKFPVEYESPQQYIHLYINGEFLGVQTSNFNSLDYREQTNIKVSIFNDFYYENCYLDDFCILNYDIDDDEIKELSDYLKNENNFYNYIDEQVPTELNLFSFLFGKETKNIISETIYNLFRKKISGYWYKYNLLRAEKREFDLTTYLFKRMTLTYNIDFDTVKQMQRKLVYSFIKTNKFDKFLQYTLFWKSKWIILIHYQLYNIVKGELYEPERRIQYIKTYQYYPEWWKYKYNVYISLDGKDWYLIAKDLIGQVISVELPPFGNWQIQFERIELQEDEIPESNLVLKDYTVEELDRLFDFD